MPTAPAKYYALQQIWPTTTGTGEVDLFIRSRADLSITVRDPSELKAGDAGDLLSTRG